MTLPLNPASRVYPDWPRDVIINPDIYERRPHMTKFLTPADLEALSIQGLLEYYNELGATYGKETRSSKFRDKPTAVRAVRGRIVEISSGGDEPVPTPGLARLRNSPQANALREQVLSDQAAATKAAQTSRDRGAPAQDADYPPPAPRRARSKTLPDDTQIVVVAEANPKRANSASYQRFELYGKKTTVAQYATKVGNRTLALRDVAYDAEHGYIKVEVPAT